VLPGIDLQLKNAALVLLPFKRNNGEFIEIDLNFTIPRKSFPDRG
jgi:hypothetical protein